ncbi:uncharacterized protein LOC124134984 [Haliotis rufescens]|uniref:uncharacterized protein LOC124134984 n=1 Tax=Haliotis rufescens TaxID=6454 RepID=UPI00201F4CBF|nr:uncharacterized protein LOC124134984 [Haliotis rufescens]
MKLATWLSMLLLIGSPLPGKPSVTFVAMFLAEALLSFGVDQLLNGLTPDDSDNDLDSIVNSLSRIEKNIQDVKISIEELKDIPTLYEAEKLERQLLVLFQEAVTVTKAINRIGRVSNSSEHHGQLRDEVARMKNNLKKIPTILVELHSLIVGNSVVSGKRSLGLACSYIQFTITKLQTVSSTIYNLNNILKQINNHRDSLMRMQVNSFQLYNGTCIDREVICNVQMEQLEDRLIAQSQRFEECVPRKVAHLARKSNLDDINIIHPESKQVLFSTQQASIIVDGVMDWEKVDSPQDAGLKCPEGNDSEIWSFQTAAIHGRGGYYLRQKSGCYLGFDRAFLTFDNILPLFWTQSDRINRKEFLICLPLNSSDVARFLLLPSAAEINTTYDLKEVETGEFLNVHVKKTSVHDEIDHRLILVLFLNKEKSNSWMIVQRPGDSLPCTESGTSDPDGQDGSYLAIIIVPIVAGVGLMLSGLCIWYKWRKKTQS